MCHFILFGHIHRMDSMRKSSNTATGLQLELYDDTNTRIYCRDLGESIDPAFVTVRQGMAYPDGYFTDVPAAKALKEGYPIRMRPGSTDVAVMDQVRCSIFWSCISCVSPSKQRNQM
jgi:hypothetical protein